MRFFDTHIHLTDFDNTDLSALILRLKKAGIDKCVCVSSCPDDWKKTAKAARDFAFDIIPAFGIHPWYIKQTHLNWQHDLEEYLKEFCNACVGECGFDTLKNTDIEAQKEIFDIQLEFSKLYRRPLLLHAVKADEILQNYQAVLPENTVFHSFSGSLERARQLTKFGFYFAINTRFFQKKEAVRILQTIAPDRLLIETDAPYQNTPEDLTYLVKRIAEVLQKDVRETSEMIYLNAERLFLSN